MLGSVRGVVSNDHSYRDKDQTSQGPRVFIRSKATCAAPLCEVPTPCRGQRPHHVQRDRIGTWEISGLAVVIACRVSTAGRIRKGLRQRPLGHIPKIRYTALLRRNTATKL